MARGHGDCPLPARPAQRPQGREHTLAHASHGRSAARSNRRPITSRIQSLHQPSHPLSVSGSAQPHDARLVPSLPPGKPRKPTPARGTRPAGFYWTDGRRSGAAGGSSSARARQATLLQRPAPSGVTPHCGRKPELMAGHSFRSGAGSRGWALAVATSAAAITAPGGQPSAQFNAWPPPCPSPQRFGSTDRRPPDSLRAAAGRRGSAFGGWRGQARQRLING